MPGKIRSLQQSPTRTNITKFTNCRLVKSGKLVQEDLWISSRSGKILNGQEVFYNQRIAPDHVVDLGGKILSPGFIDVQLNGAFGFDFSVAPEKLADYAKGMIKVNKGLVKTGVTSYTPTIVSQKADIYHKVLPYLGRSGSRRLPRDGAESLGAHLEGPFLNPLKNGIHSKTILKAPENGMDDLIDCYGAANLEKGSTPVAYVTIAPEQPGALEAIRELRARGIRVSIGHTAADYEQAQAGVAAGATMITHLFNAMHSLHHRNPGMFGLLGQGADPSNPKPYFGIIADGIHLHPSAINIAWNAHPEGFILVTDAMALVGLPDGIHEWTNGDRIIKKGSTLTLEGHEGKIAGSSITLIECVNNFLCWSGVGVAQALGAVTSTPAKMLGIADVKGCLEAGADADLVVLDELVEDHGRKRLVVEQVWKFGECVFDAETADD
ncbi:N-acetylglucosamine-6-phosphate deacetylase [Verruconis gallopava]|uniref:N-acetylglucosamine-6-phosphate deacetylase n=1 Tax=Verruconis gallopava TaxID=253628 RepID=A0A0D2AMY4_9PEZI|nr:N-acetylglucosamine-6-phosphate deacetylase [Verruconis gallopava]KIW08053.1 N-acetylglucosamine-6-phosphate deacetylase [Verruconis gallopava]